MHLRRDKGPHVDHAFQRSGSGDGRRPETQDQVETGNIEEPFQVRPRLQHVVQRIENRGNQDTSQDFSRQKPINDVGPQSHVRFRAQEDRKDGIGSLVVGLGEQWIKHRPCQEISGHLGSDDLGNEAQKAFSVHGETPSRPKRGLLDTYD